MHKNILISLLLGPLKKAIGFIQQNLLFSVIRYALLKLIKTSNYIFVCLLYSHSFTFFGSSS